MKFATKKLNTFGWIFLIIGFITTSMAILILSRGFLLHSNNFSNAKDLAVQLFIAGPFSLISGFFLLDKYKRGIILGLVTSGIFIFYAVSKLFENAMRNSTYSGFNLWMAIFGMAISLGFIYRVMCNLKNI